MFDFFEEFECVAIDVVRGHTISGIALNTLDNTPPHTLFDSRMFEGIIQLSDIKTLRGTVGFDNIHRCYFSTQSSE